MANRRGGLGKSFNEILDDQARAEQARKAKGGSRSDGLDILIPSQKDIALRDNRINPKSRQLNGTSVDPSFGVGYEVVDPAPTRGLDPRGARAQKIGYNRELKYLAILMRDGVMCGYDGVPLETWEALTNYQSTTDYIQYELVNWDNNMWDTVLGQPPQSKEQNFEQGTID